MNNAPRDQSSPHRQDQLDAYIALCHDDPIILNDESCQYLAEALIDPKSPLALSERLVDGLRQASLRSSTMADSATPAGYSVLALAIFLRIPLLCCQAKDATEVRTLLGSYRGPPAPPIVENDGEANEENSNDQIDLNHPLLNEHHGAALGNGHATHGDPDPMAEVWADESDPSDYEFESAIHEYQQQQQQLEDSDDQFYCHFDPLALSKPPPSAENESDEVYALGQAVINLLSELVYHKLTALANGSNSNDNQTITTNSLWNKWQVSDLLTQLTLTLLVCATNKREASYLLRDFSSPAASATGALRRIDWRRWGLEPLWVLRDAALAHPPQHLADYLSLLQTLLAVDGASSADPVDQHRLLQTIQQLPHDATMVGFAALSSLCHEISNRKEHKTFSLNTTRKCLLGCIDDLAQILNKVLSHQPPDTTTIMQIVWNLLPMLEVVTGIRADGSLLGPSSNSTSGLSNADAQGLLNSSLFREILFLYIATVSTTNASAIVTEAGASTTATCSRPLGRCIVFLMALSPNLLAKYAWRVPPFMSLVLGNDDVPPHQGQLGDQEDLVDCFLWNLLGAVAAEADSASKATSLSAPKVVWKAKSPVKPTASLTDCPEKVWTVMETICDLCIAAMNDVRQIRLFQQEQQGSSAPPPNLPEEHPIRTFKNRHQTTLQSLTFLTQSFQSCQPLAQGFVQTILVQSKKQQPFQEKLRQIKDAISQLPSSPTTAISASKSGGKSPSHQIQAVSGVGESNGANINDQDYDDHDDKTRNLAGRRDATLWDSHEDSVSQLRKAIKVMSSLTLLPSNDSSTPTDLSPVGSDAQGSLQNISSKTD